MSALTFRFSRSRRWLTAGLLLLIVHGLAAQGRAHSDAPSTATHEVTDEVGRTVRIPLKPQRIVSLAPSLTETVYALNDDSHLVGDTQYCDYPPEAQQKPKVGGVTDPNLEAIAALHPDLVLVTKGANRLDTVRALDSLGVPSYATDPHTVDEIISSTQKLSEILSVPSAGKTLAEDLRSRLAQLQSTLAGAQPKRVLFIVWMDPLISVSQKTFIADAIRLAGATSIIESWQEWPQISLEEVVHLQPEFLVFANSHTGEGKHDFDVLADRPGWRNLDAVRNRRYAVVSDAINRPSPRIVSVIEDLARKLHPELFPSVPEPDKQPPAALSGPPNSADKPLSGQLSDPSACLENACAR